MQSTAWVYILTNKNRTTLYTGMTNDLRTRIWEHHQKINRFSFVARYNLFELVYFEAFDTVCEAIDREKYIKGKKREWKEELITASNAQWKDLSEGILNDMSGA
jgi:putative endonuclease